ncbi:protoglobin domain-containing protein [Sulfurihydrogenibium yellowstonense]|uniref:Globin-sensor domain-containing protein n=1 Tax=Sulfurihydrogenibium yellowstonense SS-5 TaxID=432331 RepID=C4FJX6_9AQUI|nr:protoglobin domain-containing protein [Sulfurihydrogenibium yellowstonense]EEP60617.1 conserved hypothetical protein [Sulfurihydrogenibium yellowstonense SS-5]
MIENIEQIKKDFDFTQEDVERIKKLKPILEKYLDEFISKFYFFISRFPDYNQFLKNEDLFKRHKSELKNWFLDLFSGNYDENYFSRLYKIGEVHVNIGLPTHYVNAAFNFVRRFIIEKIDAEIQDRNERNLYVTSIGKLIDINLDVLTLAYREKELIKYGALSKYTRILFVFAKRFSEIIDFVILGALVIVALFVFVLFGYDIYKILFNIIPFEEGIIILLGTLLILWAVGELMNEEIKHFKGGGFAITIFVSIALAAMIRKLLIASLSESGEKKVIELVAYSFVILVLGIVYWLIKKNKQQEI